MGRLARVVEHVVLLPGTPVLPGLAQWFAQACFGWLEAPPDADEGMQLDRLTLLQDNVEVLPGCSQSPAAAARRAP